MAQSNKSESESNTESVSVSNNTNETTNHLNISRQFATNIIDHYYMHLSVCEEEYTIEQKFAFIQKVGARFKMTLEESTQFFYIIRILENDAKEIEERVRMCHALTTMKEDDCWKIVFALRNYHLLNDKKSNLAARVFGEFVDSCPRDNVCSVCHWDSEQDINTFALFFYSTTYGLNVPVCAICLFDDEEDEEEYYKNDRDYSTMEDDCYKEYYKEDRCYNDN
jgi:hypothetical protein